MKSILLGSGRPGAGIITIAINLAIGLVRRGYRVLLASAQTNRTLTTWLKGTEERPAGLLTEYPSLKWYDQPFNFTELKTHNGKFYDYLLFIGGAEIELIKQWQEKPPPVLWIVEVGNDYIEEIVAIDRELRQGYGKTTGIDLVVPNKAHPGEWKKTSEWVFDLGDRLGWEKVADPIPYCEAIHDLPQEHKSVWELPDYYNNRKEAFQHLVEKVIQLK